MRVLRIWIFFLASILVGADDLLATTGRHGPDDGIIVILGVRVDPGCPAVPPLGRSSAIAFANIDLPVPGLPMSSSRACAGPRLPDSLQRHALTDNLIDEIPGRYVDI